MEQNSRQHEKMTATPIPCLITSLAIPTVISMLVTAVYNLADVYFVSQLGTSAAAAVGIVFSLQQAIQSIGFGIGMGTGNLISYKLGKQDNESASCYSVSGMALSITLGVLLLVLCSINLHPLMRLLGATETILPYAGSYAIFILFGAPFMCGAYHMNNLLRAQGKARWSMIGIGTGSLLNIGLDPLFIYVFHRGIAGAAIATIISQFVSFCLLLSCFLLGKSEVSLSPRRISRNPKVYIDIVRVGFPTVCRQGLGCLASALMNVQAAVYGDTAVAAISIANRLYLFVRNLIVGIGQGFQPVAGYNYGAKKDDRVRQAFWFSVKAGTVVAIAAAAVLWFGARPLMVVFRADDEEVIRIGITAVRLIAVAMPLMAYSTYANQLLQCLGWTTQATLLASCRQGIFFLPLIYLLPMCFGLFGVTLTQPLSDILVFVVSVPFQIYFFRHMRDKTHM